MYEALKKFILVDLPSLDLFLKVPISIALLSVVAFLLVATWRDPVRVSTLDPVTEARLEQGTRSFFHNSGEYAPDIAIVFGNAKDLVRRFKSDADAFRTIELEIEARKRSDNNWKFANELSAGKALVNALGLGPDTPKENQIFLQMPLPILSDNTAG